MSCDVRLRYSFPFLTERWCMDWIRVCVCVCVGGWGGVCVCMRTCTCLCACMCVCLSIGWVCEGEGEGGEEVSAEMFINACCAKACSQQQSVFASKLSKPINKHKKSTQFLWLKQLMRSFFSIFAVSQHTEQHKRQEAVETICWISSLYIYFSGLLKRLLIMQKC